MIKINLGLMILDKDATHPQDVWLMRQAGLEFAKKLLFDHLDRLGVRYELFSNEDTLNNNLEGIWIYQNPVKYLEISDNDFNFLRLAQSHYFDFTNEIINNESNNMWKLLLNSNFVEKLNNCVI